MKYYDFEKHVKKLKKNQIINVAKVDYILKVNIITFTK